jgi:hypothetical protein
MTLPGRLFQGGREVERQHRSDGIGHGTLPKEIPRQADRPDSDFRGVACSPEAKPAPSGTAGNNVEQCRLNPCRGKPFGLWSELTFESQKSKFPLFWNQGDLEKKLDSYKTYYLIGVAPLCPSRRLLGYLNL